MTAKTAVIVSENEGMQARRGRNQRERNRDGRSDRRLDDQRLEVTHGNLDETKIAGSCDRQAVLIWQGILLFK